MPKSSSPSSNPLLVKARESIVVLYQGDSEQRLNTLLDELDEMRAAEQGQRRMSGMPSDALAQRIDEEKAQMEAEAIEVTLRDPGSRRMQQLQDECPPREDKKRDQAVGIDVERFYQLAVRECLVEPKVNELQFEEFLDTVGTFNWAKLVHAVDEMTGRDVDIPKSSAVSALARLRESDSRQQPDTE